MLYCVTLTRQNLHHFQTSFFSLTTIYSGLNVLDPAEIDSLYKTFKSVTTCICVQSLGPIDKSFRSSSGFVATWIKHFHCNISIHNVFNCRLCNLHKFLHYYIVSVYNMMMQFIAGVDNLVAVYHDINSYRYNGTSVWWNQLVSIKFYFYRMALQF